MKRFNAAICASFAALCSMATSAQPKLPELGDESYVAIATGYERPIHLAPAVATVFTAEDIRRTGAQNLSEILNQTPGFNVGYHWFQYEPIYQVRGFSSNLNQTVLVMIDGVAQTELMFGNRAVALGTIPLDIIERVEIIRGPGSALYGADAYSAVVNIITLKEVANPSAEIRGGSFDTKVFRLNEGAQLGTLRIGGGIEYSTTRGHRPRISADQQTLLDQAFQTNASLAPGSADTQREELGALINLSVGNTALKLRGSTWPEVGVGVGPASSLGPAGHTESSVVDLGLTHTVETAFGLRVRGTLNHSVIHHNFESLYFFPPGAFGAFNDGVILDVDLAERISSATIAADYTRDKHRLTFGVGTDYGKLELKSQQSNYFIDAAGTIFPIGPLQDTSAFPVTGKRQQLRRLRYVYGQDEWEFLPDWSLTLGARYDHYSDVGDTFNPRAALVWNTRYDLTTKLLYGRGFRAPSFLETSAQNVPAIQSNSELKPEAQESWELVFDHRPTPNWRHQLNLFRHTTTDQVYQVNVGGGRFRPENVGDQEGHGAEYEFSWTRSWGFMLQGFLAYQRNVDRTTDKDAGYSPHFKSYLALTRYWRNWFATIKGMYVGSRERVATDSRSAPADYGIVDLRAAKQIGRHIEVTGDVRNLLDADAEEPSFGNSLPVDMPLAERGYFVGLRVIW